MLSAINPEKITPMRKTFEARMKSTIRRSSSTPWIELKTFDIHQSEFLEFVNHGRGGPKLGLPGPVYYFRQKNENKTNHMTAG